MYSHYNKLQYIPTSFHTKCLIMKCRFGITKGSIPITQRPLLNVQLTKHPNH